MKLTKSKLREMIREELLNEEVKQKSLQSPDNGKMTVLHDNTKRTVKFKVDGTIVAKAKFENWGYTHGKLLDDSLLEWVSGIVEKYGR